MPTAALIPDAATYGTQQAYATQAYQKAKNNLQNQQLSWLNQYGMTGNYNADSGGFDNIHIDPNNQYGLIQQNRNSEAVDLNSARDNAIGRGIGSGGLGAQMGSSMKFQHGVQDQQLGTQFTQGMGQFSQGLNDAADTYQQALFQAENEAITRALQNQEFEAYSNGGDDANNPNPGGHASALGGKVGGNIADNGLGDVVSRYVNNNNPARSGSAVKSTATVRKAVAAAISKKGKK